MDTLSIDKKEFGKTIYVFKKNNDFYFTYNPQIDILKFEDLYNKTMNIITSMILKYHNKNDWFFKQFLNLLFFENKNTNLIIHIDERLFGYCPEKIYKIIHIIKKYKLSEILKLFIKNVKYKPLRANNLDEWLVLNKYLFPDCFRGLTILYLYLINDVKIIKKSDFFKSSLNEQLLFIIKYYYYLLNSIPIN